MTFYKYNWGHSTPKDQQLISNIKSSKINTEKTTQFIQPIIKKENEQKKDNEINEEVLLLAIKHFIDTSFKKNSDMNQMGFERSEDIGGEAAYNYTGIVVDLVTNNYMNIPNERYIEQPSNGMEKTIPLSFYFDISGSMFEYTDFLSRLAFLLLKNDISILYGFNEFINGVILASDGVKTIDELKKLFGENNYHSIIADDEARNLDGFLKGRKAEKCVVFADFDPYKSICTLSQFCKVYWFCFEERYNHPKYEFKNFHGNVYYTNNFNSMKNHFINMDNYQYVEKQKKLILDITNRRKENGKY